MFFIIETMLFFFNNLEAENDELIGGGEIIPFAVVVSTMNCWDSLGTFVFQEYLMLFR